MRILRLPAPPPTLPTASATALRTGFEVVPIQNRIYGSQLLR
jgi:hypothetical protein